MCGMLGDDDINSEGSCGDIILFKISIWSFGALSHQHFIWVMLTSTPWTWTEASQYEEKSIKNHSRYPWVDVSACNYHSGPSVTQQWTRAGQIWKCNRCCLETHRWRDPRTQMCERPRLLHTYNIPRLKATQKNYKQRIVVVIL